MNRQDEQHKKMTTTPVSKLIISLSIPTIIGMLVSALYNFVDTYFVSKLGTSATAAIGIVFSLMAIIQALGFTIGMGAGSKISRMLGREENKKANECASSSLALAFLVGVLMLLFGLLFLKPFMLLLGSTSTTLSYAMDYARYILIGSPVMMGAFVLNNVLRSQGKPLYAMIGLSIGAVVNVLLDPLFIFLFHMGIKGAALATVISQTISFIVLLFPYLKKKTIVHLSVKLISKDYRLYINTVMNGMPSFFRQGLASFSGIALNHQAKLFGDYAVAGVSVSGKVFWVLFSVIVGFGQGYQPVMGYNYGAKMHERVLKAFRFALVTSTVIITVLSMGALIFSKPIVAQFVSDDLKVLTCGMKSLRYQCYVAPLMGVGIISNMTFQSIGKPLIATVLSSCRQGIYFIPCIFLLPKFMELNGVLLSQPIADVLTTITCIPVLIWFYKKVKKKEPLKKVPS